MKIYEIIIDREPMAQSRPIFGRGHTYENREITEYKEMIAYECKKVIESPIEGPVGIQILFEFPRPKSSKIKSADSFFDWKYTKPDIDNCEKAILDGMKGAYKNDSQVCFLISSKTYCKVGENPKIIIIIGPADLIYPRRFLEAC